MTTRAIHSHAVMMVELMGRRALPGSPGARLNMNRARKERAGETISRRKSSHIEATHSTQESIMRNIVISLAFILSNRHFDNLSICLIQTPTNWLPDDWTILKLN